MAGVKENDGDLRKSYFKNRIEDYQPKLQEEEHRSNRASNLSLGMKMSSYG